MVREVFLVAFGAAPPRDVGALGGFERGNLVVKTCLNFGEWRVNDVL